MWENGGHGRRASCAQTAYRQNQLRELKSEHEEILLEGLFLSSSGSY